MFEALRALMEINRRTTFFISSPDFKLLHNTVASLRRVKEKAFTSINTKNKYASRKDFDVRKARIHSRIINPQELFFF